MAFQAEEEHQDSSGQNACFPIILKCFYIDTVLPHLPAELTVLTVFPWTVGGENLMDQHIGQVLKGIGIIILLQRGIHTALLQHIPDSLQQPGVVFVQPRVEPM